MLSYSKQNPVTIYIDGEPIRIRVRRMTDEEHQAYMFDWNRLQLRTLRQVDRRAGDEALTDDQVRAKREAEWSVDELATKRERASFEAKEEADFTLSGIRAYVTVEPGQIQDDGEDVTTGEQLVAVFGARTDVITKLSAQVYLQNTLTPEQKKRLQSLLDSEGSSGESIRPTDGPRPEQTADAVAPSATAAIATAPESQIPTTSSGTTAP